MSVWLHAETGGEGAPTLLLLHGLGANATVWDGMRPFIDAHWPGRFIAPDLRGHGRSPHAEPYGFGTLAADVAGLLHQGEEVAILAHSMGGAVGMALATGWFGVRARCLLALGVKLVWSNDDLARAVELARAPARLFDDRGQAIERYLRVAGLAGLIDPGSPAAAVGIKDEDGRFRLAADPRAGAAAGPAFEALLRALHGPYRLAAGEKDSMVSADDMRRYDREAAVFAGVGHNAHVEAPDRVWRLFETFARASGALPPNA